MFLYLIASCLVASPFVLVSWIGLIRYRQAGNSSGRSLFIHLGSGPIFCLLIFGEWAVLTVLLSPAGDPPIGAGVALLLGTPSLFITTVFAGIMGYYEWSEHE